MVNALVHVNGARLCDGKTVEPEKRVWKSNAAIYIHAVHFHKPLISPKRTG